MNGEADLLNIGPGLGADAVGRGVYTRLYLRRSDMAGVLKVRVAHQWKTTPSGRSWPVPPDGRAALEPPGRTGGRPWRPVRRVESSSPGRGWCRATVDRPVAVERGRRGGLRTRYPMFPLFGRTDRPGGQHHTIAELADPGPGILFRPSSSCTARAAAAAHPVAAAAAAPVRAELALLQPEAYDGSAEGPTDSSLRLPVSVAAGVGSRNA